MLNIIRNPSLLLLASAALLAAAPAVSLTEASRGDRSAVSGGLDHPITDVHALLADGTPVQQIPGARSAGDFTAVDLSHALLSTAGDIHYLLTLNRACPELRWARHIGVTSSGNSIWAGFDALTADGQACQIREIHRLTGPDPSSL